jgi:hypothetical protein
MFFIATCRWGGLGWGWPGEGQESPSPKCDLHLGEGRVGAIRGWLGLEESNLRIQIQSLLSYH